MNKEMSNIRVSTSFLERAGNWLNEKTARMEEKAKTAQRLREIRRGLPPVRSERSSLPGDW